MDILHTTALKLYSPGCTGESDPFCLTSKYYSQPLDKGCFGPLKGAWREVCHQYVTEHPGKVVTKVQFSSLFNTAWTRSITVANIVGGFRVTGVHPVNRHALSPPSIDCESLSRETGLPFIPMYSPLTRRTTKPADEFTEEEVSLFEIRYENGYDLRDDASLVVKVSS